MTNNIESLDVETTEDETEGVNPAQNDEALHRSEMKGANPAHTPEGHGDPDAIAMSDEGVTSDDAPAAITESGNSGDEPEAFDRPYVEKLRREAAESRVKAKRADDLAAALWTARVTATGRLADPTDLVMPDDADPLDEDAVTTAVDGLLERKPHLASRKPRGDVGAGATPAGGTVDLAALMRSRV